VVVLLLLVNRNQGRTEICSARKSGSGSFSRLTWSVLDFGSIPILICNIRNSLQSSIRK